MATKKAPAKQEPLLNAVARKLGHAAGTLTRATYDFAENLSALPETVSTKMQEIANTGALAEHSQTGARMAPRKRSSRARLAGKAKGSVGPSNRKSQKSKTPRRRGKASARRS